MDKEFFFHLSSVSSTQSCGGGSSAAFPHEWQLTEGHTQRHEFDSMKTTVWRWDQSNHFHTDPPTCDYSHHCGEDNVHKCLVHGPRCLLCHQGSVIPPVWRTSTLESFFKLLSYSGLNNGKKKVWPEFLRKYYFKLYSRRHSLCLQKRELIFVYIFQFYHRGGFNYCVRNKKSTLLLYKLYQGTSAWSSSSPPGLSILLRCVWWTQAVNLWVTSGHVWSLNVAAGQCLHWERTVSRTVLFIPELLLNTLKTISFFFPRTFITTLNPKSDVSTLYF